MKGWHQLALGPDESSNRLLLLCIWRWLRWLGWSTKVNTRKRCATLGAETTLTWDAALSTEHHGCGQSESLVDRCTAHQVMTSLTDVIEKGRNEYLPSVMTAYGS